MSSPFWPNSLAGYQTLLWDQPNQNLTLAPFGNTVQLNIGGGTGPTGAPGPTGASGPTGAPGGTGPTGTAPTIDQTFLTYSRAYSTPTVSYTVGGATLSTFSTFVSPTYTFQEYFSYGGPTTMYCGWNGTGNTNPLTAADNVGNPALITRSINIDTPSFSGFIPVAQLTTANSLSGSYGPKTNVATNFWTDPFANFFGTFQLNGPGGAFYTGNGNEMNFTFYGTGTAQIVDVVNFQLLSGDPDASYSFTLYGPTNSNDSDVRPASLVYK